MEKHIAIVIAGSNKVLNVELWPGARALDVLSHLDLHGYHLHLHEIGMLPDTDDLYVAVGNARKVYAIP